MTYILYKELLPGIEVREPDVLPQPTDRLLGYRLIHSPDGIFCTPDIPNMNKKGWMGVILTAILFWPLSCIPCCMSCSYSDYMIPVYGPS